MAPRVLVSRALRIDVSSASSRTLGGGNLDCSGGGGGLPFLSPVAFHLWVIYSKGRTKGPELSQSLPFRVQAGLNQDKEGSNI